MNYYNEHDPKAAAWLRELIKEGHIPAGIVDERSITEIKPHELDGFTQCHFFAGIGGWSLALELAGWPPDAPVWTGSCPCQPFSSAGKHLAEKDERHLWPVFFDLIRQCRPERVFGEQVASAIGKGWLDGISADLEAEGYACGAAVLGSHSVGAPHIRKRLYWVADAQQHGQHGRGDAGAGRGHEPANGSGACRMAYAALGGLGINRSTPGQTRHPDECGEIGWQRVSFAADCDGYDEETGEFGDACSICGLDYCDECQCPGPTQEDEYEYTERDGILYARRLVQSGQPGLERHTGNGDDRHQPGRIDPQPTGHAATASRPWNSYELLPCTDGKARRIEPGTFPLADGVPGRVGLLRGYGNAIVPQVAAEFILAFIEVTTTATNPTTA